jgi:hypothetical protein
MKKANENGKLVYKYKLLKWLIKGVYKWKN